jgi:hypothetical protein
MLRIAESILIDAQTILDLVGLQARKRLWQQTGVEHLTGEAKRPSYLSRSTMQIDDSRCEAAIRSDPVRNVIDGERPNLGDAPNLPLDLVVESLEGFRAGKTVADALKFALGHEQGCCRDAVLMRMTLFGRQPVTEAGMVDGVLQRAQLAKLCELAAGTRAIPTDIVINDGLERHLASSSELPNLP